MHVVTTTVKCLWKEIEIYHSCRSHHHERVNISYKYSALRANNVPLLYVCVETVFQMCHYCLHLHEVKITVVLWESHYILPQYHMGLPA